MKSAKVNFALIGAGMVSDAHARSLADLREDARLLVVYSRSEARARALAEKYRADWSVDLEEVLARPDVHAVIVATAPYNHAPHALAAIRQRKHVLLEKPMATSVEDCDRILAAARDERVQLGVILQNRLKKGVQRVKQFVESGRLGRLLHVAGYVKWHRGQSYYDANDWRGTRSREGGGVVFSQAGHTLDLMRWIGGRVEWVFANAVTAPVHQNIDIENLAVVTLRFASGATGLLEASTALWPGEPERLEIHGERGTIVLTAGAISRWDIREPTTPDDAPGDVDEPTGSGASDPMAFPHAWHRAQIVNFIDAIRGSSPPLVDGRQARVLNVLCEAIYESAHNLRVAYPRSEA